MELATGTIQRTICRHVKPKTDTILVFEIQCISFFFLLYYSEETGLFKIMASIRHRNINIVLNFLLKPYNLSEGMVSSTRPKKLLMSSRNKKSDYNSP